MTLVTDGRLSSHQRRLPDPRLSQQLVAAIVTHTETDGWLEVRFVTSRMKPTLGRRDLQKLTGQVRLVPMIGCIGEFLNTT